MPFTLSHPAASLPFVRCGLPLSALVVGSMAPDFPYFVHLSTSAQYGHTLAGLFWFCIPAGLAVLMVFHRLLKIPLLSLLPNHHQTRLVSVAKDFRVGSLRQFLLVVLTLLLGVFTHVAWDSFTHAGGWMVQRSAILRSPVLETSRGTLYLFKILQHGSTLLGATLLIHGYFRWLKKASSQPVDLPIQFSPSQKRSLISGMALTAVFAAVAYTLIANSSVRLPLLMRDFVLSCGGIIAVELLIFSGIWHKKAFDSARKTRRLLADNATAND